jgi:S1-C subfamily serine protease
MKRLAAIAAGCLALAVLALVPCGLVAALLVAAFARQPPPLVESPPRPSVETTSREPRRTAHPAAPALDLPAVLARVKPSVVVVEVGKYSRGAGLVVGPHTVLTCRHLVGGSKGATVGLVDGTRLTAVVSRESLALDLAILTVGGQTPLPPAVVWAAQPPRVGDAAFAMGHPYGYDWTATRGIVSAVGREIEMPSHAVLKDLIQTDAAINEGNSGGPLLSERGEVLGVVVAIHNRSQGIAFVIDAASARKFLEGGK